MEFDVYSHRNGLLVMKHDASCLLLWKEIIDIIDSITERDIINLHFTKYINKQKSISMALNYLFKQRFSANNWLKEPYIFNDSRYMNKNWRLDFAKEPVSVEVAFNHSGSAAWNLMKPVIASELNHVQKAVQTKIGVIICAMDEMRSVGGFDNAVGTYEKYIDYLKPLRVQLTTPLVIIGLKMPKNFEIKTYKLSVNKTLGRIYLLPKNVELKRITRNGKYVVKSKFRYYQGSLTPVLFMPMKYKRLL
ncbi:BglII/BstYI family type II restriction endonuclease [Sporosarcina sp. ITBMC105]